MHSNAETLLICVHSVNLLWHLKFNIQSVSNREDWYKCQNTITAGVGILLKHPMLNYTHNCLLTILMIQWE